MNTGGEAAEQIVRMSLEGFEVAAKITGAGAKNIAILLYSILKEEQKTKGKARLTNMLRSGKELKVFKHAWTNKDGTYKEVYYYICGRNKQERGHYCEYKASLRKTDIEPLVIEAIRELVSDKSFAKEIKKRFGVQTDTSKIDKELANYESKLKEVDLNKARLEREIDNLPADAKYRERKIHDMTIRLDGLYDTIVELEERIEDAKLRRSSIEMEAITLENVYRIMENFSKLYAIISDEEKKSLVSYLIKEIQIYPNGTSDRILKSIEFNFPIYRDGREIRKLLWENGNTVDTCYQTWWELQCQVEDYYSEGKKRLRPPLSQQKEFRQIKNAVIREAEHIRMNKFSFEDEEMQDDGEQISTYGMSYECQDLQSVANDESYPLEERDRAAEQMEQLADAGDAHAQYIIGMAYRDGGLLIPDTVKAQKLLERAAEQDLDAAQYALGKLYLSDDADVHDPAKGIYWLKRSADNGNDYAAYRLGKEYLSGKNTVKDAETAVSYLRRAADNGNAYAQYLLGKLTLMGEGIPKDMDAAYEWFAAARDNGHTYAEFFMKRMERGEQEPPSVLLSATRLLYHMGNIFRDNAPAPAANGVQIDRKRLAQMRQKRVALGHKPDDHELEQQQGFSMKFHM